MPVSRRNFVELCLALTGRDEQAYEERLAPARAVGGLVHRVPDRSSDRCRAVAQRGFLRNLARGEAYLAEAPSLWDVTFGTAVAQAELEDRPVAGGVPPGGVPRWRRRCTGRRRSEVVVATTRPELLPACVALVAHPDDERYAAADRPDRGHAAVRRRRAGARAPRWPSRARAPGIVMVCTFGDTTDVTWWRDLQLPTRATLDRSGRLAAQPPAGLDDPAGRAAYAAAGRADRDRGPRQGGGAAAGRRAGCAASRSRSPTR